jgi:hypothetical protein
LLTVRTLLQTSVTGKIALINTALSYDGDKTYTSVNRVMWSGNVHGLVLPARHAHGYVTSSGRHFVVGGGSADNSV